jgi:Nucleotidyltransferase domain
MSDRLLRETLAVDGQLGELEAFAPGLCERLALVRGVVGVALGGSRARGTQQPGSDFDIGIYYETGLDIQALQRLADEYSNVKTEVTSPGSWGPWVDGGGWLVVNDVHVDFIYRNVDRVTQVWADCQEGRYTNEIQAGHPLGFWSHAYVGELVLALPASQWSTELARLRDEAGEYPQLLSKALTKALWESSFSIANARKAIPKGDVAYVAGCLFRAAGVMAHALHGHGKKWLLNEKGAIASAGYLLVTPVEFARRVALAFEALGSTGKDLADACERMQTVVDEANVLLEVW